MFGIRRHPHRSRFRDGERRQLRIPRDHARPYIGSPIFFKNFIPNHARGPRSEFGMPEAKTSFETREAHLGPRRPFKAGGKSPRTGSVDLPATRSPTPDTEHLRPGAAGMKKIRAGARDRSSNAIAARLD